MVCISSTALKRQESSTKGLEVFKEESTSIATRYPIHRITIRDGIRTQKSTNKISLYNGRKRSKDFQSKWRYLRVVYKRENER